jgi:hypothetical protein
MIPSASSCIALSVPDKPLQTPKADGTVSPEALIADATNHIIHVIQQNKLCMRSTSRVLSHALLRANLAAKGRSAHSASDMGVLA